jgi:transposase
MTTTTVELHHERVDDIPLLLGVVQQLGLPEILEKHLGSHHLHQGLSNGWLASGWLAFILSEANHCKASVQGWAQRHHHTLQTILGQPLRPVEFSDDRLSIVLRRLHDADWTSLEADLWQATCQVYEIPLECVRLDASTSYGYHQTTADGVMQFGHSKDHRPDLPQLKLMAAAAQPTSHLIACDIVPGNAADDPLYLPLIRRTRKQLGRSGLLYAGDCKMAALAVRAELAWHKDYYLMPLPKTGETAREWDNWVGAAVSGKRTLQDLYRLKEGEDEPELFARGYEFERTLQATVEGEVVTWAERVQVICSLSLAERQAQHLEQRLQAAASELRGLTPPPGRGHHPYREEALLAEAVAEVMTRHRVAGLLEVNWRREEVVEEHYVGRGRGGADRPKRQEVKVRYEITSVERKEQAIRAEKELYGWRVQVTNLESERCGLEKAVLIYNGGWSVERDFHMVKDRPLGIQPLYVREEEQIIGLTRLLTIALRVLTGIELQVRAGLEASGEELSGLYEGQPKRKTSHPTAVRLLRAIARMEITVIEVKTAEGCGWHLRDLPSLLRRILSLLRLSPDVYLCLATNSG